MRSAACSHEIYTIFTSPDPLNANLAIRPTKPPTMNYNYWGSTAA
ncbi:hypothetical protein LMG26411_06577 [Cupriavidus numazuensis]|uniref:Uncharacterized protein n=1 Tax=Cupriavidus numazuensis TaxID=221992 RepID=A0ABM8TSJ0_9BURK|nr:hypothetical protein LMG26411_06577 [Cupriavidus numazuensis]